MTYGPNGNGRELFGLGDDSQSDPFGNAFNAIANLFSSIPPKPYRGFVAYKDDYGNWRYFNSATQVDLSKKTIDRLRNEQGDDTRKWSKPQPMNGLGSEGSDNDFTKDFITGVILVGAASLLAPSEKDQTKYFFGLLAVVTAGVVAVGQPITVFGKRII